MASPSSSATTPSPVPMAPLSATVVVAGATHPSTDADTRKRAVEKFKARAEISNITRSLRTRLSYASYKATHNIAHMPLRELEAQSQSQIQIYARTMAAKRKATAAAASYSAQPTGTNNYYNNPATQGGANTAASGSIPLRRPTQSQIQGSPSLGARSYYPNAPGASPADMARPQTLFTSILAPPPSQPARTILNASDPPLAASTRPPASPRTRPSKAAARSIAEGTRLSHKSRADDKHEKRKAKRSLDKGKQKQRRVDDVDADGDVDMKAAATLTSLLLNSRPSIGSASSPRSSLDESDAGSTKSYSHFAQSSARHVGTSASQSSASAVPDLLRASATPPPIPTQPAASTPRAGPSDNEAADLMLFLATSPSPVRKGDQRDLEAYRALNGSRPKGRVLFPTAGSMAEADGAPKTAAAAAASLSRGMDSFTSSVSSIGGEMRGTTPVVSRTSTPVPGVPTVAPVPTPAQLLPPPTMPAPGGAAVLGAPPRTESPKPPQDVNYSEFLHPSPVAAPPPPRSGSVPMAPKPNLGLRADVGRKLFEEEQMRQAMAMSQGPPPASKPRADEQRALGAGIDLMQS